MLALTALLSLAAYVSADQTFSLVGEGDNFNYNVEITDAGAIGFNNGGSIGSFTLAEPSGYISANGKEVIVGPEGFSLSTEDHSKDFGVEDGKLRFGVQGTDFYACPNDSGYTLSSSQCDSGVSISLYLAGAASSAAPASSAPATSAAPVSSAPVTSAGPGANSTVVESHSTLVTVTSCSGGCTKVPEVSSYEGGAAQAGMAAGAVALAGALLL